MSDSTRPPHQLSPQVHLDRARGYFELEMFQEVEIELRAIDDQSPWSKQKREMLIFLHQERMQWELMQGFAKSLRLEFPDEEGWWVSEAYATRRAENLDKARKVLLEGLTIHYESAIIRYNLACYACLLGNLGKSLDLLKEAGQRDEKYKTLALEDEDLELVHEDLIKLGWEKKAV
ncbi:MAG TPA: hypothetical protein DHU78_02675 [Opitutae bacterium]|nr:hypothetical protein [Puniceicoccaceae bacterium]HCY57744.1 hypothetical protein [Opitutae bacterium]